MEDKLQEQALDMALNKENKMSIINGGAGVGKSYVINEVKIELQKQGFSASIVAPTGKAALRVAGTTIHRWLEPDIEIDQYGNEKINGFLRERFDPGEILIVDESSMVDTYLYNEIMKCLKNSEASARIIWVGDEGQLEPVGAGQPFLDMLKDDKIAKTTLKTIHRTKEGNDIIDFAYGLRTGNPTKNTYSNVHTTSIKKAIEHLLADPVNSQIIAPMKKGVGGTVNMNKVIQECVGNEIVAFEQVGWNNDSKRWKKTGLEIKYDDKILITRNMFINGLTNGTVGRLDRFGIQEVFNPMFGMNIKQPGYYMERDFDGKELFIPANFAERNVDLAYAITVHKFQGSENKNIFFMVTPDQQWSLKNKKLTYTAATRASEKLYLVNEVS